jgi:hypothetical protein
VSEPVRLDDAIDAALDEKSIEHLDFAPRCSIRKVSVTMIFGIPVAQGQIPEMCGDPAVSMMTCKVCHASGFCCEPHRTNIASDPNVWCASCNAHAHGSVLYVFTPLGGV